MDEIEAKDVPQVSLRTFRQLVEEAPDGIVISRSGIVLFVNRAALALLRYEKPEDLVGKSMATFLDEASIGTMVRRLRHMQTTGERVAPREYVAKRRDGTQVVAEITSIFIDFDGSPAVLAFARDVTERVQLRAQLERADRLTALGVMAAGVAHEINNPLTFISLAVDLLHEKTVAEDAESIDLLNDIREGVGRVAAIVRDLRVYSRYEEEALGAVDLEAVLHVAGRIAAHELKSRVKLVRTTARLPPVRGVARRLEQVFVNLYLNAAQSIPEERTDGMITVRSHVSEDKVVVEVVDNGPGMPPDVLERIFEPFFTKRPANNGTGLGLFICRDILVHAGGAIEADSEVGKGTTMTIKMPRAGSTAPAAAAPDLPSKLRGRRILVVDDEPLIVATLVQTLGRENEVVGETNSERAVAIALSDPPFDAIVCDMTMDGLSGVDVYEHIAQGSPGMEERIVFVSGGIHTAHAKAFLARIDNPCLTKPFAPEKLSAALAAVCKS